jgi:hypothetical protein
MRHCGSKITPYYAGHPHPFALVKDPVTNPRQAI